MARAFAIALLIVVITCALLLIFGIGLAQQQPVPLYQGVPQDAKLLQLDKQALDEAYRAHVVRLWNVWLTDGAKEAHRISNGLRISRQAYHQAAEQITKREQELKDRAR